MTFLADLVGGVVIKSWAGVVIKLHNLIVLVCGLIHIGEILLLSESSLMFD